MFHLVLGFLTIARSDAPALLYVGKDADAALTAAARAVADATHRVVDRFTVSSPITLYADIHDDLPVVNPVNTVNTVNEVTHIPIEIGHDAEKIILHLQSEEEVTFVRNLDLALSLAVEETKKAQTETLQAMKEVDHLRQLLNAEARKAATALRQKATQLNQAAVDAASAADAAKGKPGHPKALKAAEEALAAAKLAETTADEAEAAIKPPAS